MAYEHERKVDQSDIYSDVKRVPPPSPSVHFKTDEEEQLWSSWVNQQQQKKTLKMFQFKFSSLRFHILTTIWQGFWRLSPSASGKAAAFLFV